ncbi:MAG: hypothetical protein H6741_06765 [Alphaproteobacteria bacterium]|nr:hypothetical protein [Alphaproteobacteria bacterium]MCB9792414.1 hypothetical protein [Alphaproteobacteria bacterium]
MRHLPLILLLAVACRTKDLVDTEAPVGDDSAAPVDADGDGFSVEEDCDDADPAVNPSAEELCDGVDNNCDGVVDEDSASDAATWYADADADGYGDEATATQACEAPEGAVAEAGDCDDSDPAYNPGAEESDCTDPNDYNCDGSTGYADEDGDGYAACEECDDADAAVNPSATEVCDGIDNDCDGEIDPASAADAATWYADSDGDGYGDSAIPEAACSQPTGFVSDATDCDDSQAAVNPGASEATCNGLDDDCDSATSDTPDGDGDGYSVCEDCDDADAAVSPGASEATCNGVDDDCDSATSDTPDADGDGYSVCEDCDDGDAAVSPGAAEATCNGVDDDCDSATSDTPDGDGDGYSECDDCDDGDASIYPSATELCDAVDNDCDGDIDDGVLGTGADCPADSCLEILSDNPNAGDGVYTITTSGGDFDVVCDMTEDGGGWTLALVINSVENGNYALFGSTYEDVADLQIDPATASSASTGVGGWLNINDFSYSALRLASYLNGANTYWSADIDPAELRINFGQNGYLLYNDSNGYYWCGGDHSYTDSGSGQVNQPSGAPSDCKGHGSLGHGWDFSDSTSTNRGLTLCGQYSSWMYGSYYGNLTYYPNSGAAQAIWLR